MKKKKEKKEAEKTANKSPKKEEVIEKYLSQVINEIHTLSKALYDLKEEDLKDFTKQDLVMLIHFFVILNLYPEIKLPSGIDKKIFMEFVSSVLRRGSFAVLTKTNLLKIIHVDKNGQIVFVINEKYPDITKLMKKEKNNPPEGYI